LQITSASSSELRKEADEFQRRLRELEEQIQSNDRVERLESSLKYTQDRADELEFQLTKLKQVC
jgi:chromosome segregation ATPase